MNNDIKHTPTPWDHDDDFIYPANLHPDAPEHDFICQMFSKQERDFENKKPNVEFIVRACNAHDDMVKALKEAEKELEACYKRIGIDWPTRISRIIKSAIAKAEGKQ